jgi:predicted alpha/beta hydrolase family esterase
MKKKVLISYIWHDRSDEKWLFWLKKQLERKNFDVSFSELPKEVAKAQNQAALITSLQKTHAISEENTHYVAHDPGCLTILSYLEYLNTHNKTDPTLLIAGIPKESSYTIPNSAGNIKKLEAPKAIIIGSKDQELQLSALNIKLIVIYSGVIEELQPKQLESGSEKKKISSGLRRFFFPK